MGFIKYALTLGTGLFIGYIAGTDHKTNERYELFSAGKADYVRSIELNKSYQLKQADNDFFLGDMYHQMKGVQVLTKSETRDLLLRKMNGLNSEVDSLDSRINKKDFLDKVEDTGKSLKQEVKKFVDKNFK